jgi:hypothetical protein
MIFGGRMTRVLDYSLMYNLKENHKINTQRNVEDASGHHGGMGGRKWDENTRKR